MLYIVGLLAALPSFSPSTICEGSLTIPVYTGQKAKLGALVWFSMSVGHDSFSFCLLSQPSHFSFLLEPAVVILTDLKACCLSSNFYMILAGKFCLGQFGLPWCQTTVMCWKLITATHFSRLSSLCIPSISPVTVLSSWIPFSMCHRMVAYDGRWKVKIWAKFIVQSL